MYCYKCGFKNVDDYNFCTNCGSKLQEKNLDTNIRSVGTDKKENLSDKTKQKNTKAIEGWLSLVALGLILSPFLILFSFFQFDWLSFHDISSDLQLIVVIEQIGNFLIACFSVYLLILMGKRKKQFPLYLISWLSFNIIFLFFDYFFAYSVLKNYSSTPEISGILSDAAGQFGRSVISGIVWIPYVLRSKRVKETFTN